MSGYSASLSRKLPRILCAAASTMSTESASDPLAPEPGLHLPWGQKKGAGQLTARLHHTLRIYKEM